MYGNTRMKRLEVIYVKISQHNEGLYTYRVKYGTHR